MITIQEPTDWRDLQAQVARVLRESGMQVDIELNVRLARGSAEIDVVATEYNQGRSNKIFCECKHWKAAVPQNVVHSFGSVIADAGANTGYIVASSHFQRGARAAAANTNVKLLTWEQFLDEFENAWIANYLRPEITSRLDDFMTLVEPLPPRALSRLNEEDQEKFIELRDEFMILGIIAMQFSTYTEMLGHSLPELPLRARLTSGTLPSCLSDELLDAVGHREFLANLIGLCSPVEAQLKEILSRAETGA